MNKKMRNITIVIFLVFLLISLIYLGIYKSKNEIERLVDTSEYIIATHYFADEWPANFWNAEWNHIDDDFQQIREDGFNTIIVVVPWREFQPTINEISYHEHVFDRMRFLFQKAEEYELSVQLRIGYLHDFYSEEDTAQRFYDIIYDDKTLKAWYDYLDKIYEVASQYPNFIGGFITWEDFWHNYALVDYVGGTEAALNFPARLKFIDYIKENYSLDEFNVKFNGDFSSYDNVPIPARNDLYAEEWFAFIDDFTMELLSHSREVFPDLNMEVRTDNDPIGTTKGKNGKYSHERTWNCTGADFMTIMYQPLQGNHSVSKHISARAGVKNLESWLENIYKKNGNLPIYIDQFLYYDNTPSNEEGDIIAEDELGEYIESCCSVFEEYTRGYGVWTYKDYCANMLYNSQFLLGDEQWEINDDVVIQYIEEWDSFACKFNKGGYIEQKISLQRNYFNCDLYNVTFDILDVAHKGILKITMGSQVQEMEFDESGKFELTFFENDFFDIKIQVLSGECVIDNIRLYSHVQQGYMYDINGQELDCIRAIRRLNQRMQQFKICYGEENNEGKKLDFEN